MIVNSKVKRLFEDDEIEKLKKALKVDDKILPAILKIINDTISELQRPTSLTDFENNSWPLEKAYREGGVFYLQQLLNTFKEK